MTPIPAVRPPDPREWTLTARWILPGDAPPLPWGCVTIAGEQLVAVLPQGQRPADVDLGEVAVLPGLVNTHTHLDLSGMKGLCPPTADFTSWLRGVVAHRRSHPNSSVANDVRRGLEECLRFGTTLIGDISGDGTSWDVLAEAPVRAVVFRELLGLSAARAVEMTRVADHWLTQCRPTDACRPGLSPHAPYSARQSLIHETAARSPAIPFAIHLAESKEERALLEERSGPFVTFLRDLGAWDESGLEKSLNAVLEQCAGHPAPLLIHGNYLEPSHPISDRATVVYCPRTHAAFGHPPHPIEQLLARGVRVALGTDGLSSNPDLDLLAEVRLVHKLYPCLPGATLVRLATLSGAEALGWSDVTGSLTPGKSADLVVIPLEPGLSEDPYRAIFESTAAVTAVLFRGTWRTISS